MLSPCLRALLALSLVLAAACEGRFEPGSDEARPPASEPESPLPGPGNPGDPSGSDAGSPDAGLPALPEPGGTPAVQRSGRFDSRADVLGPTFEWPGATLTARFRGTSVSARLKPSPGSTGQYSVYLDGEPTAVLKPAADKDAVHVLAERLPDAAHTVTLVYRNEPLLGRRQQFLGFTFPGGELLAPPPLPTRRIEIIGDSITCGYGSLGVAPCTMSADNSSVEVTYGWLAAKALGAEPHIQCWSGIGVYRNNGGSLEETMPQKHPRTLPRETALSAWDFSTWTPQVVVVNLGTNDFSGGAPSEPLFRQAYVNFLRDLREHYPAAELFVGFGPMQTGATLRQYLENVIEAARTGGDSKVTFVDLATPRAEINGCAGHPGRASQQTMATKLEAAIRAKLGW